MSKVLIVKNSDKRMKYISEYLEKAHEVIEVKNELHLFYELSEKKCDALILPVRTCDDHLLIDGTDIILSENYLQLLEGKILFTGLIPTLLNDLCEKHHVKLISYLTDDLSIENNYITTEGIIESIVNHSESAIYDSNILIIGYGKLGQITSHVLKEMKAKVTVSARNEKDIIHAKIVGLNTVFNHEIKEIIEQFDFIINTVPYRIIDDQILDQIIDKDVLLIDVASKPYGLDHEYAKSKDIKTLLLPGIPGKIAPRTAGTLIAKCINQELGVQ